MPNERDLDGFALPTPEHVEIRRAGAPRRAGGVPREEEEFVSEQSGRIVSAAARGDFSDRRPIAAERIRARPQGQ